MLESTGSPSLASLLINLGIGVVLALIVQWHFKTFGSTLSNREEFGKVFPFIVLTTTLVITVVKSSLALSLGLVGALSIVRFRTPVKEPEELAYLFVAIAIGLGLGADQTILTVAAAMVILGAMAVFRYARHGSESKDLYLSIDLDAGAPAANQIEGIARMIAEHAERADLRRLDARDTSINVTYFVDMASADKLSALLAELQEKFPGIGVTFIDQNRMPSV